MVPVGTFRQALKNEILRFLSTDRQKGASQKKGKEIVLWVERVGKGKPSAHEKQPHYADR
jgi:hypothetical protein